MTQPMPGNVQAAFQAFPPEARHRLAEIRAMILGVAAGDARVGAITETLKWGEPAYLTEATGSGSTIRLGLARSSDQACAVLFNCQTSLVDQFRTQFPTAFAYQKNRAILLSTPGKLPQAKLATCLAMALTYHRRRRPSSRRT